MTLAERFEKVNLDWFLMEPALYKVLCSHQVVANAEMMCPMRCGKGRIEYQPQLCGNVDDMQLAELMKIECIRILLKHPYDRQPSGCSDLAVTMGSDCVVADNYALRYVSLKGPDAFGLLGKQHFEYYAKAIQKLLPPQNRGGQSCDGDGDSDKKEERESDSTREAHSVQDSNGPSSDGAEGKENPNKPSLSEGTSNGNKQSPSREDLSALWEENPLASAEIKEMIKVMEASNQWGSISGNLVGKIIASTKAKIDYRKVMQSFRQEVLSSKRRLTRMRPNRRSGFENFGSVYRLTSRLLVAIDVSGSTTDEMVSEFFGVVNKFFKYGIEEIGVIQFDCAVKGEPLPLKKAKKDGVDIVGRGGTDYQPVFDYADQQKNYYQGLLIFTDGYADEPKLPDYFNIPVLWVVPDEKLYEKHKGWMRKYGKVCFIQK